MLDFEELGKRSGIKYFVMDIQSDWPAYLEVGGGRYWRHNQHPCPLCLINQEQLYQDDADRITLDHMPYEPYTFNAYSQDVLRFTRALGLAK